MTHYLSTNFTADEFTHSQTAARLGIVNDLPVHLLEAAKNTAYGMEHVRKLLGNKPILISSGYRSPKLNEAVGGSKQSQHCLAEAVDFTCPLFGSPDDIIRAIVKSNIMYDQVIREFGRWVHISFGPRMRKQALIIDQAGTRPFQ